MRAVLDANVFYSIWVTDPLLSFADVELYEPVWSERITVEVRRHLPSVWSRATREGVDRYLRTLAMAFPEASVAGWEYLEGGVRLPDPDDRHVVAAAIKAGADVIVTSSIGDFPAGRLKRFGLCAISPDVFLVMLFDSDPEEVVSVMRFLVGSKSHPPRTMQDESGCGNLA